MQDAIRAAGSDRDSVGGILETIVTGLPAGIGEPWFDSVESERGHLMFAIPACKGLEFGAGFRFGRYARQRGQRPLHHAGRQDRHPPPTATAASTEASPTACRWSSAPSSSPPPAS